MTEQQHPITPPPELIQQWRNEGYDLPGIIFSEYVATRAYQAGADQAKADIERERQEAADQELEACLGWLVLNGYGELNHKIRASRRSKSQSLKEQALDELDRIPTHDSEGRSVGVDVSLLRRALESIPDLFVAAFTSDRL